MKVGQIVECNFGVYRPDSSGRHHADGRVPPEMIKSRLAVVLNSKLRSAYVVVPLSKRHDKDKEARGYHVRIESALVPWVGRWGVCERWAKAELIHHVSAERIFTLRDAGGRYVTHTLPREIVAKIQRAVINVVGARGLLQPMPSTLPNSAIREFGGDGGVEMSDATVDEM